MATYYSDLSNLRLAKMITQEITLLLRDTSNLRNSQFLTYYGSINGSGSKVMSVRKAGLDGYNKMSGIAENATGSDTAITESSVDITVGRQYLSYEISDLASMTGLGANDIDPFRLARSIAASYESRFAELQCDTADGLSTNVVGSSSDTMSVDLFFDAIFALEQAASGVGVDGQYAAVLHPKQLVELQDSLRNETSNSVSMMTATQAMLEAKGRGFVGSLFGVEVYRSSHVTNAASAHNGYMITPNCLGYIDGTPTSLPQAVDFMTMGKVLIEMERTATQALTRVVGHAYLGMAIIDQDRGCLIKSST
tara:strand:- start:10991 stop:11917 length:927 start_codon:yes stop_codon:yes gene_type:complete